MHSNSPSIPRRRTPGFPRWLTALFLLFAACDAPHHNPLDPENPDGTIRLLTGSVRTDAGTPAPIGDARATWTNEGVSVTTDAAGRFRLSTTRAADGWLRVEKTGFRSDSTLVRWNNARSVAVDLLLDATPVLDSLLIYTVVKNWYSQREYSLGVDAFVADDDDIDTVRIENAELGLEKTLTKISSSLFQGRFDDYDLPVTSLEELIGRPLSITAQDAGGRVGTIGTGRVSRIIQDEVELLSPLNQDTMTAANAELRWRRFEPGFRFVYFIEIYTDEPEPVLVWSRSGIASDAIAVTVDPPITVVAPENRYFWVTWCIDELYNRSRSKPASFIFLPAAGP